MKSGPENIINEAHNRREFFRRIIRYPAAIALVAIGGGLEMRSIKMAGQGQCSRGSLCGGCLLLTDCELPQAVQTRGTNKSVR
jgi:hypothetical protein